MQTAEQIYARAFADLTGRMGVKADEITPAETVALVRAAERVANPFGDVNAEAAGVPVSVTGGAWFWPLTVGAVVWIEDTAEKWWPEDPLRYRNALVYASVHARDAAAFERTDRRETEKRIRACLRGIAATSDEVDLALTRVLGIRHGTGTKGVEATATSWAALVAKLEAGTGLSREHWLWDVSYRETLRTYHEMRQIALAHGGEKCARMLDELDEAVNALQTLKVNIMKRVKNG